MSKHLVVRKKFLLVVAIVVILLAAGGIPIYLKFQSGSKQSEANTYL